MEICKLTHISKSYRMGELVSPLKDVSLTVQGGDFLAVEGPSGIGKSTLLYVMGTLLKSDEGTLSIGGKDVWAMSDRERTALRAEKIGFLFQDSSLIQALTLRENLIFAMKVCGRGKADRARIDGFLERLGLADRASFFPHQLSGGQRRRAMTIRGLIHSPALILADEPTNDLDEEWAGEVIRLLAEEAARGAGVVMVTHNSGWTGRCNRRCRLEDGAITDMIPGGSEDETK